MKTFAQIEEELKAWRATQPELVKMDAMLADLTKRVAQLPPKAREALQEEWRQKLLPDHLRWL